MAKIQEATLFRPETKPYAAHVSGGEPDVEQERPRVSVGERIAESLRSVRRRLWTSMGIAVLFFSLTGVASTLVPRTYEAEARVLVQRTQVITGNQSQQLSAEDMRNIAREYEEQVLSHENIVSLVRQAQLVERWDRMRPPHRRLFDTVTQKLGSPLPSDDAKFDALVDLLRTRLKVWVDPTTVTIKLGWYEPEAARALVDAAVKNFLEARFQSEVGVIPQRLSILEAGVAQSLKELEIAATELGRQEKLANAKDRVSVALATPPRTPEEQSFSPESSAESVKKARLESLRQQIAALEEAKLRREAELGGELLQKRQVLAEGHPDIIALRQTLEASHADPAPLGKLRAEERELRAELLQKRREPEPRAVVRAMRVTTEPSAAAGPTKSVQDAHVQFDAVTKKYTELLGQLDGSRIEMKTAEAAFKNRYKLVHPAEMPLGPKKPVGAIVAALGVLVTMMSVFLASRLADRAAGIFYEPRAVRDELELPVFASLS